MKKLYLLFFSLTLTLSLTAQQQLMVQGSTAEGGLQKHIAGPSQAETFVPLTDAFDLVPIGTYATGIFDEGAAEIVAYDAATQRLFFTNADANSVTILSIADPTNPVLFADVDMSTYGGGVNSLDVANGVVAVAVEAEEVDANGKVVFLDTDGQYISDVEAGVLPDMVIFTNDGTKVITANEGQPSDDYTVDPEGSVSIIEVATGNVTTVDFTSFNGQEDELRAQGVRIFGPGASAAQDFEPEYIVVSEDDAYAFVILQENNAIAKVNLSTAMVEAVVPLGFKDHSIEGNGLDASNRTDGIEIKTWPVLGMYMPDAAKVATIGGNTYIVTANEGDSRDYDGFSEEERVADLSLDTAAFPNAASLQEDSQLGRLKTTNTLGDTDGDGDFDVIYSYGARSFSIWDENGQLVYDSGDEFEQILAQFDPLNFNSNNDENGSRKSRSDDKGPEPEAVEIVVQDDKVYALIGLERMGGIIVYNITDPTAPLFVNYVNNRNFNVDATTPEAGDLGVEDIVYIPAEDSPNGTALVVTANEVSGTITVFGTAFEKEAFTLRLIHNNDGESKLLPDSDGFGGAAHFKTISDSLKAEGTPSIFLSSGDNILPGTTFNASLARQEGAKLYDSEVLDALGYDAIGIGNHDFDFGPEILARVISDFEATLPPYLAANLDFAGEPSLQALVDEGRIAKKSIIDVNGEKVGVIGLVTETLDNISSPRNVTVDPAIKEIAQQQIDELLAIGINKIILISHLQSISNELELAAELTGVDIVIAGGGDELLTNNPANEIPGISATGKYPLAVANPDGDSVYVVTTPGEYRYVGNMIINFDSDGKVESIGNESDVILVQGVAADQGLQTTVIDSIIAYNEILENNVIAVTEVDLDGTRTGVRSRETNEGNLIADAFLYIANREAQALDLEAETPIIVMQNGGGIRNNEIIAAGSNITERTTFNMLPFANFVSIVNPLTPAELKSALENSVSGVEFGAGRFSQVAGFSFIWDSTGVGAERRVFQATLDDGTVLIDNYLPVQGAPNVYVVTNSFVAAGGDSYDEFENAGFQNLGISYQRALFEYLVAEDGVNGLITAEQYPAGGEGRIIKGGPVSSGFTLRIIHNNDGESKLLPDDMGFGGAAEFKTVSDSLKAETGSHIMLSSGDNFLAGVNFNASLNRDPSLPYYDAIVLDSLGYDAICIGNHDFDFGPDVLANLIGDFQISQPPYLSANLDFSNEPNLLALVESGRIAPRTVVEVDGEQIGVIGLTTELLANISSPRNVVIDDMIQQIAQAQVDELLAEGVNKIILISHLQSIQNELDLAANLTGVDVIIAGGGDELLVNDPSKAIPGITPFGEYPLVQQDASGKDVYIVTTPGEYRYVGNLTVNFDDAGEINFVSDDSDPILVQGFAPDSGITATVIDSINAYAAALESNIVAITEVELDGTRQGVRSRETNQGNLIADAFLWLAEKEATAQGLDAETPIVVMQNGGGIRNNELIPAGTAISEAKTFDMLPFSNFVSIVNPLTPEQFKSALENSVSSIEFGSGRFSQIAGFSIVYDTTGVPDESRIISATLDDGTAIVADKAVVEGAPSVYVVTNSFVAAGGDSYDEFEAAGFINLGSSYQKALFDYLVAADGANGVISMEDYPEGGEGRIVIGEPTSIEKFDLDNYNFVAYPNPFSNVMNVRYSLSKASSVSITMVDMMGRTIRSIVNDQQLSGQYNYQVDPAGLSSGMYILRVVIDGKVAPIQMIKK